MGDDPAFLMIGTPPVNGLGPCELGGHGSPAGMVKAVLEALAGPRRGPSAHPMVGFFP